MKVFNNIHHANNDLSTLGTGEIISVRGRTYQVTSKGLKVAGFKAPKRITNIEKYNRTSNGKARSTI